MVKIIAPKSYPSLLADIKKRIYVAQQTATLSVNHELILLYWDIGRIVTMKQNQEGWGSKVIEKLSHDLKNDFSDEIKGFSVRNINRMKAFYREYPIMPQLVAQLKNSVPTTELINSESSSEELMQDQLQQFAIKIPWGHNILLIEKIKNIDKRLWYMQQTIINGWSRSVLTHHIEYNSFKRTGNALTNFDSTLPPIQSDLARQSLKDPYIFDFLTLDTEFREAELEARLISHLQKFLIELGVGFAFVGQQYHISVSENDFYIDLLFYHLKLRCFVVIELKKGKFKPEYAGKLNFYLNVVDNCLTHANDNPSIGLILGFEVQWNENVR